ncbi:MAG TPA: hypothetical protein VG406_22125 [Isosphaeraceae bacterium]|jgi:hypothetical protein|nr:hypothetical protein [Isosphaeraceae bacterium]
MSDKSQPAEKATGVYPGGVETLDLRFPVVNLIDVYPDASYSGPSFIYQPPGDTTHWYSFQLVLATSNSSGHPSTQFRFKTGAPLQSVYLPYIQSVSQPTQLASPMSRAVNVQTRVLSGCSSSPQLVGPNVIETWALNLVGPSADCRHVSLRSPASTTNFIPSTCVHLSVPPGSGLPGVFRLHLNTGAQACFLWLQVDPGCSAGSCPTGYADGPPDLFLQYVGP